MVKKHLAAFVVAIASLGLTGHTLAGGWPPGTKFAYAECAVHPKKHSVPVICKSNKRQIQFKQLIGRGGADFDWMIEVNSLPLGTTLESLVDANTAYAVRLRRPPIAAR